MIGSGGYVNDGPGKPDPQDTRWNPRGMKLPNFRETALQFPVWSNYTIVIIVTTDDSLSPTASYISDRDFNQEPSLTPTCDACTMLRAGRTYLCFKNTATAGTIAHEAWHAIYHMLTKFAGAEIEDETVAYHLGYLVDQITQFITGEKINVDGGSSHTTRLPRRARRRRIAKRAQKKG